MAQCTHCFREKNTNGACPFCGYDGRGQAEKYPLALRPGSILNGRYIVGHVIGQGGFGITYIAQDYRTKARVAVKEYLPMELASRGADGTSLRVFSGDREENFLYGKEQFLAEAKTLAAFIGDEHIVRIHSYFEENGTAYFVMDYVDGPSLDKYMKQRGGRLSPGEAGRLLLPLMESLGRVHEKGIVHRDIAPDNILIENGDSAKLIDFGAARYSTGEKSRSLDVILKHGFAPYEQYMRRGRQGPWTDVYALAATFYYAITGRIPPEAIERQVEDILLPPSNLGVDINYRAEEVLGKALEVLARDRYQSMAEFHRDMQAALAGELQAERAARERERLERERQEQLAREEAERQERERQERLAREKAEQEEKARREREAKAEAERLKKEEKERLAREKAERQVRERREKEEKKAAEKAAREAAKAEKQAAREATKAERQAADAGKKKSRLPLLLAALAVLVLAGFGVTRLTRGKAPAEQAVETPVLSDAPAEKAESSEAPAEAEQLPQWKRELQKAGTGDTVVFGTYEQDNNESNGKEPIEWLVLAKEDGRLLVISEYALDAQSYHSAYEAVTWENSTLRTWLNTDFLQEAFDEAQQAVIPMVTVSADRNPNSDADPGSSSNDRIFLLSIPEAEKYFDSNEARQCLPTMYAKVQGADTNDNYKVDGKAAGWWWLRSPGASYSYFAAFVSYDGEIETRGISVDHGRGAVRPAMWIDLSA